MRTKPIDPTTTLAELVLEHPECARVLREHRLDYCCRGELALDAACAAKGLDLATVVGALETAIAERVERSLFAMRGLSADDWLAARAAYAEFALAAPAPM